ncbi:hypothetical protein HaLaN_24976 [Haematococcus lacustris]|uniref:Uncharacterized protein n=1 Tax=Haematococcus lacustris TaxID=44745 RepID=A0A699ZZI5_HAELA|nr:hypothetical protein HaLaN_24976 [Haematococcus lacustris]
MVATDGTQLETAFGFMLALLFASRLKKGASVPPRGAKHDAARTGFRVDTPATGALHEPLRLAARRLQTAPGTTAATKNSAIRVALGMVVSPNETQLTFIPAPTFGYAYAPLKPVTWHSAWLTQ